MKIFILLLLLHPFFVVGQTSLIPYLSGNQYGLADESGKIILDPQFDAIAFTGFPGLFAMKKNELWGFLNAKGEIVFPCTFQVTYSDYKLTGPPIRVIGQVDNNVSSSSIHNHVLIQVRDAAYSVYYFNPYWPGNQSKAYQFEHDIYFANKAEKDFKHTGLLKVKLKEGGVNFLDSLGSEVLTTPIEDGKAIGDHVLLIKNAEDKWGVYNLLHRIEPEFLYDKYYETPNPAIFKLSQHSTGMWSYINSKGQIIAQQLYDDVIKVVGDFVLMNESRSGRIYHIDGTVRAEIPGHNLHLFSDSRIELQSNSTGKYGLADLDGKVLLESRFTDLQPLKNNQIGFSTEHSTGVMDSALNILWEKEQWRIGGNISGITGYYKVSAVDGRYNHYGMTDSLGKLILTFLFTQIHFVKDVGLFQVSRNDSTAFFDRQGKMIVPFCVDVDDMEKQAVYVVTCEGEELAYAVDGTLLGPHIPKPKYSEGKIVKTKTSSGQTLAKVVDDHDRDVIPYSYHDIRRVESPLVYYRVQKFGLHGLVDSVGRELIPCNYRVLRYSRYIGSVFYATDDHSTYVVRPHASPFRIGGLITGLGDVIVKDIGPFYYFATVVRTRADISQSETTFFDKEWNMVRYEKGIEVVDDPAADYVPKGFALVRDHTSALPFMINLNTGVRYRYE